MSGLASDTLDRSRRCHLTADVMVNVGWGKKETQFHGSAGKEAARQKEIALVGTVQGDNGTPQVSWCGDGNSFATLVVEEGQGGREHSVFERW